MTLSVIHRPGIAYPDPGDGFSPGERYPEYPFDHLSGAPNPVYGAVRDCLAQAGLDAGRFGTPAWNPLGGRIRPGSRVFVLCNFVYHRRPSESPEAFFAKCTHGSVIRALLDYVLIAAGKGGAVRFGNAPVQSCDWDKVLADTGADAVERFYRAKTGHRVEACDLRLFKVRRSPLGGLAEIPPDAPGENGDVAIDLAGDSLLDELYAGGAGPRFRLEDYDPRETEACHRRGHHVYRVSRKVLESDVLLSVPKLKTHARVVATLGIKGCVGSVSRKSCLAHHREGSPATGGDQYADGRRLIRLESLISEMASRRRSNGLRIVATALRRTIRLLGGALSGSWPGNDTSWRMSLDIARILAHADAEGTLLEGLCREHLLFVDGIVSGEGQGPLSPSPRRDGFLLFSDDLASGDRAAARFMGYDPDGIPLLRRAVRLGRFPLTIEGPGDGRAIVNGKAVPESALGGIARPFRKPAGW